MDETRRNLSIVPPPAPRATRLLLVEDNSGDARLLAETLVEAPGARFELTHVGRLSEAARELAQGQFDLVLLDLSLPDSMGLETFVRLHVTAPHLPYVVLTGLSDESVGLRTVRAGAQDFLIKGTMGPEQLVRALSHAIVRHRARCPVEERVLMLKR